MNKKVDTSDIKLVSIKNRFISIEYKALDEKSGPHSVAIDDSCDSVTINKDVATLIFSRKINIDDNSLFMIDIKVETKIKFKKEEEYSELDYKKHFKENYMYYYRNTTVASTISLVVGQITSAFGRNPLLVAFKDQ